MVVHAHLSNHAWQRMGSTWRPSHQWGLRVTQMRGACDHIWIRVGHSIRREDKVRMRIAGMHGGAWGRFSKLWYMEHACTGQRRLSMRS